jgi:hypothetical protein
MGLDPMAPGTNSVDNNDKSETAIENPFPIPVGHVNVIWQGLCEF